jgi:hypothetical protein
MADTVPIYGISKTTKIYVTVPCSSTPVGNQNLSVYMDRLSNLLTSLAATKDTDTAKTNLMLLKTEIRTSNPTVPFPTS